MKIKALRKKVGQEPELIEIDNSIDSLHKEVGGFFEIIGSYVCNGNFLTVDNAAEICEYNCKIEGREYYGTVLYVGPISQSFPGADEPAIKRYRAQANYGNLGKGRWIWQ